MLTLERLKELLSYDAATGEFRWKVRRGKMLAGSIAGTQYGTRYRQITIDWVPYSSHVLAWFYSTGEWPEGVIDHKAYGENADAKDNLRLATWQQNRWNSPPKIGHSKWKGVTFDKGREKCWKMAFKMPDGTKIQRRFSDEREAAEEYMFLALEHHGEFARLQ